MWWSYPCLHDGKTQGTVCGYCKKIYLAQVKARGLTQAEYGNELGADPDRLEGHMALVQAVIQQIVSKGFVKNSHIQWEKAIVYSLRAIRSKRAVKRNVSRRGHASA